MKFGLKVLAIIILIPTLFIGGLSAYWWLTYIDEDIVAGSAYGFTIGSTKEEVIVDFQSLRVKYPESHIYIRYGNRAGDNFSIPAVLKSKSQIYEYDKWNILLDGKYEFFNSIDLKFESGKLVKINKHRQNFELP
ncbi:hypothetical protein [Shewanella frigidimarina]|uniref:hypothetical protein n=1 Tax=Shewanella frigidimarina TaxID=56812 RepID=UPI003F9FF2D9